MGKSLEKMLRRIESKCDRILSEVLMSRERERRKEKSRALLSRMQATARMMKRISEREYRDITRHSQ